MTTAPFGRLLVIGAGLLGTSVALAVKRRWPGVHITAIDRVAARHAPFDRHQLAETEALPPYDLAVLACPLGLYGHWMPRLAAHPDRLVTDIGSLKRDPAATAALAGLREFVGGHPMAGGTRAGPGDARADLFDRRPWYVVPGTASAPSVERVRRLAEGCGATVFEATAEAHDAAVAAVSHLPQLAATLLMVTVAAAVDDAAVMASGPGLRDTTRLADGDFGMWREIVHGNAARLAPLLRDLAARASAAADAVASNPDALGELFAAANAARRRLPPL
jgi:prephenate dehydrogenase